jgi:uncharacterized protein YhbP (UPF0306 family)
MDTVAHARELLARIRYVVLATAGADGVPWATPVWFAPDGLDRVLWLSWPGSRHSRLVAEQPRVALAVFDSSRPSAEAAAFYARATATVCPEADLDAALAVYNRRTVEDGLPVFPRERVTGDARLRLYAATLLEAWVLDQDADVDQRAPVPLRDSRFREPPQEG